MNENDKDKLSDILLSCDEVITEYVLFEMYFVQKDHPSIKESIPQLETAIDGQYKRALQLITEIIRSCSEVKDTGDSRKEHMVNEMKGRC